MNSVDRYFLAIIPPSPIYEQVMDLKTHFRNQYNCKAPMRSPAHITLCMPFTLKPGKEAALTDKLREFAQGQSAFSLALDGFGAFAPRVIYIAIAENPALRTLQKALSQYARRELGLFNANYKDRGYNPHMTIAFRDLKKALFPKAWEAFRNKPFCAEFEVVSFWLLKHDGKQWLPHREFLLSF